MCLYRILNDPLYISNEIIPKDLHLLTVQQTDIANTFTDVYKFIQTLLLEIYPLIQSPQN